MREPVCHSEEDQVLLLLRNQPGVERACIANGTVMLYVKDRHSPEVDRLYERSGAVRDTFPKVDVWIAELLPTPAPVAEETSRE